MKVLQYCRVLTGGFQTKQVQIGLNLIQPGVERQSFSATSERLRLTWLNWCHWCSVFSINYALDLSILDLSRTCPSVMGPLLLREWLTSKPNHNLRSQETIKETFRDILTQNVSSCCPVSLPHKKDHWTEDAAKSFRFPLTSDIWSSPVALLQSMTNSTQLTSNQCNRIWKSTRATRRKREYSP